MKSYSCEVRRDPSKEKKRMQNQMRLCQRSPSYLYKLTTLQLNLKHRIHSKIGQHQNILYRSQKKTLAMRILYLQLELQIDYTYDCYNHKQFTFHL